MTLEELLVKFHEKMLVYRAIDAYIVTDRFERAYEKAGAHHRAELLVILKSENLDALKTWVYTRLIGPLDEQSYRELRERAKQQNVSRWSRLSKDELLEELCNKRSTT